MGPPTTTFAPAPAPVPMEIEEGIIRGDAADAGNPVMKKQKSVFTTDLLRQYYARLFPYNAMFRWLSYGQDPALAKENPGIVDKDFFMRREFSFTIANDIYIRYLCFRNEAELREAIQKKQPHKIDIGAVYSAPPKDHLTVKASAFKPVERELVFDIDLTDYDEVRTGCTPDMMWEKGSWLYMSCAVKVVDAALRDDFGFKHLLWVFSGRRGVHCWVCDESARQLTDQERTAIVNYLTLITGNSNTSNRVGLSTPMHPAIERALPMLEDVFTSMVLPASGQGLLLDAKRWNKVLNMIPDPSVRESLDQEWQKAEDIRAKRGGSVDGVCKKRWGQLKATVDQKCKKLRKRSKNFKDRDAAEALERSPTQILILHTYPRLDVNVSTHRNHLLKSPFVIHPKTGKVCVPIFDVANCHEFDPDHVPNLVTLLQEIDAFDANANKDGDEASAKRRKIDDFEKTSLKPFVDTFNKKFLGPMYNEFRARFRSMGESKAATTGNW